MQMTARKPKSKLGKRTQTAKRVEAKQAAHRPCHSSLSHNEITILAETFRLLDDPSRLKILFSCVPRPISVGDISDRLDLSLTLGSHHLRLLRGARLVNGVRQGKQISTRLLTSTSVRFSRIWRRIFQKITRTIDFARLAE